MLNHLNRVLTQSMLSQRISATRKLKSGLQRCEKALFDSCHQSFTSNHRFLSIKNDITAPSIMEFKGNWPDDVQQKFLHDFSVIENFISPEDELELLKEIEPYLKRMRYETDHWDDAIQSFRETERKSWFPRNKQTLNRIIQRAFPHSRDSSVLPHIHVLDLEKNGFIKPHVDSVRYCGDTISGISLLSDSVMKLVQTSEDYSASSDYRNQPAPTQEERISVKVLLKRFSLYIMSNSSRYNFTHEILKNEESFINHVKIEKGRRISIICRNEP